MGFVRTIARRQLAAAIRTVVPAAPQPGDVDTRLSVSVQQPDPERRVIEKQNQELAMRVLRSLPKRDREVLIRFYLEEQMPSRSAGKWASRQPNSDYSETRVKASICATNRLSTVT
jgi:DNA-directed RNA polymerase specialized sigma24 family protein